MRKTKKLWMLAAIRPLVLTIVFCGATVGLTACDKANAQNDNPASRAVQAECRAKLAWAMPRRSLPSPVRAIYGFFWYKPREFGLFF